MSGIYFRCRSCQMYRPRREFSADHDGRCRVCDPPVRTKRCKACGLERPVNEFHVNRNGKDGRRTECMSCRNHDKRESWRQQRDGRKATGFNDDPVQRLIVNSWG